MKIFIEDSFDSAHYLPNVKREHKCSNIHGHTYRVRLIVEGPIDPYLGWVVDYSEIKHSWNLLKSMLDHKFLNDILPNPTCELIAEWIGSHMPTVTSIELRETERCGVIWTRD